jgi:O-glycosyl hydrolase
MLFADFNIVGVSGWIYWNLLLDTTGGPWLASPEHNDPDPNPQQPVIIVDPATDQYYLTGCYYAMAHFGRFLKEGSVRVESIGSPLVENALKFVSFLDESTCSITMVVMNNHPSEFQFSLVVGDYVATVTLSPVSFSTLSFELTGYNTVC